MPKPLFCTNQSGTNADWYKSRVVQIRVVQSPIEFFGGTKHNDVIFNYVIIEMASLDNPSVCILGVLIDEGPLYHTYVALQAFRHAIQYAMLLVLQFSLRLCQGLTHGMAKFTVRKFLYS